MFNGQATTVPTTWRKEMFKRLMYLAVVAMVLSLFLAACGGADTPPTPSNSKTTTVPDTLKQQLSTSGANLKELKVEAYSTKDAVNSVKSNITDQLGKAGWKENSAALGKEFSESAKQFESLGIFAFYYEKGSTGVIYFGMPSTIAGTLGATGLAADDNLVMMISGKK
jgi:hypothetical protein